MLLSAFVGLVLQFVMLLFGSFYISFIGSLTRCLFDLVSQSALNVNKYSSNVWIYRILQKCDGV
jgi:hypothetical protein